MNTTPWKPKQGEWYWLIDDTGDVCKLRLSGETCQQEADRARFRFGNYFKTKIQALRVRNIWRTALHGFHSAQSLPKSTKKKR